MNLGLIAPGPGDGTSFYRAVGPLSYLSREYGVRIITAESWDWTNVLQCDAIFLQRPFSDAHGMVAKWCQALNVPLWVDYDDLYNSFPDWTPVQQDKYGSPDSLAVMSYCLRAASAVTVSTLALGNALASYCRSPDLIHVVPNALNTYLWPMSVRERRPVITWRGSGGHIGDLDPHVETIQTIARECSSWGFHWLGRPHYKLAHTGTVHPYQDLFSYMAEFMELAPSVHIVPLADCTFNRCKSNIAWLEASAAGAVVVAPDMPEWRRPGIVRYATSFAGSQQGGNLGPRFESLDEALRWTLEVGQERRTKLLGDSREHILEKLRLSTVNQKRWEILCGLCRGELNGKV